jgi:uncharacterized membrane protein YozB (DUF420 family)
MPDIKLSPKNSALATRFGTIALLFLGALMLIIYVLIFKHNTTMFVALICLYLIAYSLFVMIYTNQNYPGKSNKEYTALSYITIYTLLFAIFMFISAVIVYIVGPKQLPFASF